MRRCPECAVAVEGDWEHCPLCTTPLTGRPAPEPFPAVPLTFSRRRLFTVLLLSSLAMIVASFAVQLIFSRDSGGIGVLRSIWLGVCAMWLVALMAVRKRRNVAKGTVYVVILVGLVCTYWDYLTGWQGWALTYAIPIFCAGSIVAVLILVRLMRVEVGEYIPYCGLTVLLGLAPIVFLALGQVTNPLPSAICITLSVVISILLLLFRGAEVRHELAKRLRL